MALYLFLSFQWMVSYLLLRRQDGFVIAIRTKTPLMFVHSTWFGSFWWSVQRAVDWCWNIRSLYLSLITLSHRSGGSFFRGVIRNLDVHICTKHQYLLLQWLHRWRNFHSLQIRLLHSSGYHRWVAPKRLDCIFDFIRDQVPTIQSFQIIKWWFLVMVIHSNKLWNDDPEPNLHHWRWGCDRWTQFFSPLRMILRYLSRLTWSRWYRKVFLCSWKHLHIKSEITSISTLLQRLCYELSSKKGLDDVLVFVGSSSFGINPINYSSSMMSSIEQVFKTDLISDCWFSFYNVNANNLIYLFSDETRWQSNPTISTMIS